VLKEGFAKSKKEFSREIKKLGSVRHPNLVPLCGYYWGPKEHERIMISDYADATSLSTYLSGKMVPFLHPLYSSISVSYSIWMFSDAYFFFLEFDEQNLPPLSARQRLNIAIDIAHCLDYLHNEQVMPHGNNKSSNVLIQNSTPSALVTDYNLHRMMTLIGMAEQVLNTGALGYSPPEFSSTSKPCPSLRQPAHAAWPRGRRARLRATSSPCGRPPQRRPCFVD
jgi:serine/threonine protein kinase